MSLSGDEASPVRVTESGLRIAIQATPRGGRDAILGVKDFPDGARLRVRLAAPPADGAANAALTRLLAKRFGVARGAVAIASGAAARFKTVEISGDPAALQAAWAALRAGPPA